MVVLLQSKSGSLVDEGIKIFDIASPLENCRNHRSDSHQQYKAGMMTNDDKLQTPATMSDREIEIIELVTAGLTNEEISTRLEISKRTVDNHISNILKKAGEGVDNRVALVRWALQWGKVCLNEINCCTLPKRD